MPPVSPFSWTSDRDYKLHSCAVFALEDWPKVLPKTQGLQPVYLHYRYNIVRVRTMMLLPFQAASMSADIQRWIDRAQLEHFGTLMPEAITAEDYKFINKRCEEMSQKELVPLQKLLGTPA